MYNGTIIKTGGFIMKKTALIATTFFFFACLTANAQMGQQGNQYSGMKQGMMRDCMMQGGMMQGGMGPMNKGVMAKSMKKSMMMVNMLPGMQEELSLSQEQTENLIDLQTSFKKQQVDYKAEMAKETMKLESLLEDEASADEIKSQMKVCSDIKINMHAAAYETGKKMKALLKDEQKADLEDMMTQQYDMMMQGSKWQGHGGMKRKMMMNQ